jgi:hypothetical protein
MKKNAEGKYIADDPRFPAHIYPLRIMRKCSRGHEWGCVTKKGVEDEKATDRFLLWLFDHCPLCPPTNSNTKDVDDGPDDNVFTLIK